MTYETRGMVRVIRRIAPPVNRQGNCPRYSDFESWIGATGFFSGTGGEAAQISLFQDGVNSDAFSPSQDHRNSLVAERVPFWTRHLPDLGQSRAVPGWSSLILYMLSTSMWPGGHPGPIEMSSIAPFDTHADSRIKRLDGVTRLPLDGVISCGNCYTMLLQSPLKLCMRNPANRPRALARREPQSVITDNGEPVANTRESQGCQPAPSSSRRLVARVRSNAETRSSDRRSS